jgi:hypothetical protein
MSSAFHAVQRSESFTGFGNRPDFTPAHQQVLPSGMTVKICESRTKPVSGIVCNINSLSSPHKIQSKNSPNP